MIKALLFSGITLLSLSQAHAMMDPDDSDRSVTSSAARKQEALSRQSENPGASSTTLFQVSDHKQNQNPGAQNNEPRELRDQNAAFAKKEEFERRLAALESQLNDTQIGAPRNVIQLSTEQMDRLRRNKQRHIEENEENCQK